MTRNRLMAARRRAPNPAAGIDDWLNLVDPDGAFLTASQLRSVFPHGFDPMPATHRSELRARTADLDADESTRAELRQWLLGTVLEWSELLVEGQQIPAQGQVHAAEYRVYLRPTQALLDVEDANTVRLGVFVWPTGTRLDRRPEVVLTSILGSSGCGYRMTPYRSAATVVFPDPGDASI